MSEDPRRLKDAVYEQLARVGKSVSSPKRLELLELLCQGPRTVEALAKQASMSVANTSQHLKVLRAARLVEAHKKGLFVEYRLADDEVARFVVTLRTLAEARLAELDLVTRRFFDDVETLESLESTELLRRIERDEVTVLDVRPRDEYRAAHIPGAISMPLDELASRLSEIPAGRDVVAYCRGPYCVMAAEAVSMLRAEGVTAHRVEVGVADWLARGLPLARGGEA